MGTVVSCQDCEAKPALRGHFFSQQTNGKGVGLDFVRNSFYLGVAKAWFRSDTLCEHISICWPCLKKQTVCRELPGECHGKILLGCHVVNDAPWHDRRNVDCQVWCSHHLYSEAGAVLCRDVAKCTPSDWRVSPIYKTGLTKEEPWTEFELKESDFLPLPPGPKELVEEHLVSL